MVCLLRQLCRVEVAFALLYLHMDVAFFGALAADSAHRAKLLPGGHGGAEQIVARIACEEVDMLLFFRDPISAKPSEPNEMNLLRI